MQILQNRKLRLVLILLLAGILVYSLIGIVRIQLAYRHADQIYEAVREQSFSVPETATAEAAEEPAVIPAAEIDLAALTAANPDILGWLWMPDTGVSHPLVQGQDNQKYLNRTYNLERSASGSIFMDFRIPSDFSGGNTIVYGHNMKNGSMFGSLKAFSDGDYLMAHRYIYIYTAAAAYKYQAYAAYKTDVTSKAYTLDLPDEDSFGRFISAMPSFIANTVPTDRAPQLTLSTCTSGRETERFVLHASLVAATERGGAVVLHPDDPEA